MKNILKGIFYGILFFVAFVEVVLYQPALDRSVFLLLFCVTGLGTIVLPCYYFLKGIADFVRWVRRKYRLRYFRYFDHDYKD